MECNIDLLGLNKVKISIDAQRIIYIQSDEHICIVQCLDGTLRHINMLLKDLSLRLPSNFYRLHKQFIVNLDHVYCYGSYPGKMIRVTGGYEIPLAKNKRLEIHQRINNRFKK